MELLRVADLTKRHGEQAVLAEVGFAIEEREILGLIGAGKTTLPPEHRKKGTRG